MKKIGIMGGTFNPIHNAHLILAEQAYWQLHLDQVVFLPTKHPPHKDNTEIIPDEYRLEMIRLAIEGNPHFTVSDLELTRTGTTYTAETLEILKKNHPEEEYYFIMGGDSLMSFDTWRHPEIICHLATLVTCSRAGYTNEEIRTQSKHLQESLNAKIVDMKVATMEISSGMLRAMRKENQSIRYYVPENVNNYIIKQKLYF